MNKKLLYLWRYFFWFLSRLFCYCYLRPKFNLVLESRQDAMPKPPFIMIANHATFFDPWLVGHLSKYPLSIMMNEEGFRAKPFTRWYLHNVGTFPKKKGASDYRAMKTTLQRINDKYAVLIFPEGQTSWDGQTQPIFGGLEKLIKKAGADLVMMRIRGNFLSKPWWANSFRKGCVHIHRKVLSAEYLRTQSDEQLRSTIIDYIHQNDIKDPVNLRRTFTGSNLTGGLERFVWICKQCLSEDTLVCSGNRITCNACKSSWDMNAHFQFSPLTEKCAEIGDLHDWSLWHKRQVIDKINASGNDTMLTKSTGVLYCKTVSDGTTVILGNGTLSLSKQALVFTDSSSASPTLSLPLDQISDPVFQRKDMFECHCGKDEHRFRFIGHSPMKWVYYLRYLKGYEEFERRGYI